MPEIIRNRIKVYSEQTEPLKEYYQAKGLLVSVTGRDKVEDTTKAVMEAIGERQVEAGL